MATNSPYGVSAGPFPYSSFNTTGMNYTGPAIGGLEYTHLWTYLDNMKRACDEAIGPDSWVILVAECVLRNLSEQQKANQANEKTKHRQIRSNGLICHDQDASSTRIAV